MSAHKSKNYQVAANIWKQSASRESDYSHQQRAAAQASTEVLL